MAKGSRNGVVEIIYAVVLEFEEVLRNHYMFVLDFIRVAAFYCIGSDASQIPKRYSDLIENTFAADFSSLAPSYSLSQAYQYTITVQYYPVA